MRVMQASFRPPVRAAASSAIAVCHRQLRLWRPFSVVLSSETSASEQGIPTASISPHLEPNASSQAVTVTVPLSSSRTKHSQPAPERPVIPYHVARTPSGNLPVYTDAKRGGNLHQTIIRKITGDAIALRDDIRELLQGSADQGKETKASKSKEDVVLNSINNHVIIKGWHVGPITEFLKAKGF